MLAGLTSSQVARLSESGKPLYHTAQQLRCAIQQLSQQRFILILIHVTFGLRQIAPFMAQGEQSNLHFVHLGDCSSIGMSRSITSL
jgi:hypothetical protein